MTRGAYDVPDAFDAGADAYDGLVSANPGYHDHLRLSAQRMQLPDEGRGLRLLDIGCGTGASTAALLACSISVIRCALTLPSRRRRRWRIGGCRLHRFPRGGDRLRRAFQVDLVVADILGRHGQALGRFGRRRRRRMH